MAYGRGLTQAYELRDLAASEAIAIGKLPPPADQDKRRSRAQSIANLIKAWEAASDRVRIMRGLPLPGSRKPEPKQRKQSAKWSDVPPGAA